MSPPLHVVRAGRGPLVVLVHGSATDSSTWTIQLRNAELTERVRLVAYDRLERETIEEHAGDLAALIEAEAAGAERARVIGSSFGGAVGLELARRGGARLAGLVMMEPPLPPSDDGASTYRELQASMNRELDRLAAEEGAGAAAELFLRTVLGEAAWGRLPRRFQERSKSYWPQIRSDTRALTAYRVRYGELGAVTVPVRLFGGETSAAYFRPTLEALRAALGRATLEILPGAGHMMHAEVSRTLHERWVRFAEDVRLPSTEAGTRLP
jgi:pimeloyl-ACP methyl ester carboxylesterase